MLFSLPQGRATIPAVLRRKLYIEELLNGNKALTLMVSCREAGLWLSLGPPLDGDLSCGHLEGLVEMGVGG